MGSCRWDPNKIFRRKPGKENFEVTREFPSHILELHHLDPRVFRRLSFGYVVGPSKRMPEGFNQSC